MLLGQKLKDQRMKSNHLPFVSLSVSALFVCWSVSAAVFQDNFSSDPLANGWRIFGESSAFHWNSTNGTIDATWDSTKPSGYFYHSLGTTLAIEDTFSLEFDLKLRDAQASGFFQLAIGLFNIGNATNSNFSRAIAASPNLFEFDYYPDGGFGPSMDATLADSTVTATNTSHFYFAYDNLPLDPGIVYHVVLTHSGNSQTVAGMVLTNGQVYTALPNAFPGPITDFRLDAVSISSYTSSDDPYGDSVLAHGTVDNVVVTLPLPPITTVTGGFGSTGAWEVQFASRTNWVYALQRTPDFQSWSDVSATVTGSGNNMSLSDTNPPIANAFYRVRASRP
jgi:hypothetical protein